MTKRAYILLGCAVASGPCVAVFAQDNRPVEQYVATVRLLSFHDNCKLADPTGYAALVATRDDLQAQIAAADLPTAQVQREQAVRDGEAVPCTGSAGDEAKATIRQSETDMAGMYLARALAVAHAPETAPWAAGLSTLPSVAAKLDIAGNRLATTYPDAFARMRQLAEKEALKVLAAVCRAQHDKVSQCPKDGTAGPALGNYARGWLKRVQDFGLVVAGTIDTPGKAGTAARSDNPRPEEYYWFGDRTDAAYQPCENGQVVAYLSSRNRLAEPPAGTTLDAPVYQLGTAKKIGNVKLRFYGAWTVTDADPAVKAEIGENDTAVQCGFGG